jgi:hypothetical protein
MTAGRYEAFCHSFGCILCCSNVLKCPRRDQPVRMVIWTTVIDHCKSHISFRRRQMNNQSKAVSVHPNHTRLLVPMLDFAHQRAPGPCGNVLGSAWQVRSAVAVASCFRCSMTSARVNAAAQVRSMPCCVRQRNKAFAMAGDELVDTCCAASGAFAAQSATKSSATAAVMMDRRIVAIATTPRPQVLSFSSCSWRTYPCWHGRDQRSPLSGAGGNSQLPRRLVVT